MTVTHSIFTGNSATSDGGGIGKSNGTLTVSGSTFSGNTAQIRGGGVFSLVGTLNITNCTFANNSVGTIFPAQGDGAAIWTGYYGLNLTNSTLSGNWAKHSGGGIYSTGTLTAVNTIIANSTSGGNCFGAFAAGSSHNLATDSTCSPGFTQVTQAQLALGTLTGSPAYFPLNSTSVAIDTGTNSGCPAVDQRGVLRPQDGNNDGTATCDVGAYEFVFGGTKLYLPLIVR